MEFLLELLFEVLGEVFLENGVEMAADHRLPRWASVLILTVTALVFAAVFGIILVTAIGALSHTLWISLLLLALDAVLVLFFVSQIRKGLRARSRR